MNIYLSYAQMPELRRLSSSERKKVYVECIRPLLWRFPFLVFRIASTFVLFAAVVSLGLVDSLIKFILFVVCFLVFDHISDISFIAFMRRDLRKAIDDMNQRARIQQGEQAGTGQPATSPESRSEGGYKPQPESEWLSR